MFFLIFGFFLPNLLRFYKEEREQNKKELDAKIAKEKQLNNYINEMKEVKESDKLNNENKDQLDKELKYIKDTEPNQKV